MLSTIRRTLLAAAVLSALAAPSAFATIIDVSNPAILGTVSADANYSINLTSQLPTLGLANAGTLTLEFETPAATDSETRVVTSYNPGSNYSNEYITYTVTDDYTQAQAEALVTAAGGNHVSGESPMHTVSPLAYDTTSNSRGIGPGDVYFVYETDNLYSESNAWSGVFTETLTLNSTELANINSSKVFNFTVAGTNSPDLISDNLQLNSVGPLPAPKSTGLLVLALASIAMIRRRKATTV